MKKIISVKAAKYISLVLSIVIFALMIITACIFYFVQNPYIPEICSTGSGSFEYMGEKYVYHKGYTCFSDNYAVQQWNKIGRTDKWEDIYSECKPKEEAPKFIYIDGEKPAIYIRDDVEIPVSGKTTTIFVYSDPYDYSHYHFGDYEEKVSVMEKLVNTQTENKKLYKTDDIKNSGKYFSFAYEDFIFGDDSRIYFVCCINTSEYVFVSDIENDITVNSDGSAEIFGTMITDEEIIDYLKTSSLFFYVYYFQSTIKPDLVMKSGFCV